MNEAREVLGLWSTPLPEKLPPANRPVGKRAEDRRSDGHRRCLKLCMVSAERSYSHLCVMAKLKIGNVPALIDTGAHFSCIRRS